ncbi:uncharacterized protein LOC112085190 [Eutrema salsugineum]|uniref:uncharacterized protein LOC112085190 n=1 Tax=Eutrema salsugineum TaxID=72664 RepID=UPI000CED5120|nr:uncharacterized protein LOC112085190 [Eutrema salsugineum]
MRKVVTVGTTFLKAGMGCQLVFAACQDGNRHHYPIAFGVIDTEKNDSYDWFFRELKTVIPDSPELVIVSDRNVSLINAVAEVYPEAKHAYCIWHLSQNVKLQVLRDIEIVAVKFRECARQYTETEFLDHYTKMALKYPKVTEYLERRVEVWKWARCYFPGDKYNLETSNIVESLNTVFKDARRLCLLPMVDKIVAKLCEWFNKHKNEAASTPPRRKLVAFVENIFHSRWAEGKRLTVTELNISQIEYSVIGSDGMNYTVNLKSKTCSCKWFDIDKYPCVHAFAAHEHYMKRPDREEDIYVEDLCSTYYLTEQWAFAYNRTIYPIPHKSHCIVPDDIKQLTALTPEHEKKRGGGAKQQKNGERQLKSKKTKTSNKSRPESYGIYSYFTACQSAGAENATGASESTAGALESTAGASESTAGDNVV